MGRIGHPVVVRFGENTLRTFKERSIADLARAEDDIFFVHLGALRAAPACATRHSRPVVPHWRTTGCAGIALYESAATRAANARRLPLVRC
ncbi:hypothetical protein WS97_28805 [Burkholderia territorii]|uniref:hypothetical protein n=1 Tax=Burkholderia territorii TaxID=1503055 RepID=UPI00075CCD10|nr:hypothetical protein [Burkholderia territorii]KVL27592.1 hypothetical protein WS97_28805 [Burkholderia territorii]